ncbi:alpha/beta fold hydrolase [Candidatus Omnitrophota bacterium]
MSSAPPAFKYIDRKKDKLIALIPGWASDQRIFSVLNLEFNYLMPLNFSPFNFEQALLKTLKKNKLKKISLFGWSLGGFLAARLAAKYGNLFDQVILVSVRKRYCREDLDQIRKQLSKNKKGFLYKFYLQCFSKPAEMSWFKQNLLKDYCQELDLNYLLEGLDYLECARIDSRLLNKVNRIKIIHGQDDRIAPVAEAREIKNGLNDASFISVPGSGHMPFLKQGFSRLI